VEPTGPWIASLEDLEPFWFMGSAMAVALPVLWVLERRRCVN
jgi:hypothetical protein